MAEDSSPNTMKRSGIEYLCAELPDYGILKQPEKSGWGVWLMGDHDQKGQHGAIVYYPNKGQLPNWFHRKMQELCFGFQWRKVDGKRN
jgi:hypothetical protein